MDSYSLVNQFDSRCHKMSDERRVQRAIESNSLSPCHSKSNLRKMQTVVVLIVNISKNKVNRKCKRKQKAVVEIDVILFRQKDQSCERSNQERPKR